MVTAFCLSHYIELNSNSAKMQIAATEIIFFTFLPQFSNSENLIER